MVITIIISYLIIVSIFNSTLITKLINILFTFINMP